MPELIGFLLLILVATGWFLSAQPRERRGRSMRIVAAMALGALGLVLAARGMARRDRAAARLVARDDPGAVWRVLPGRPARPR